ncbi:trypsin-like peptidase domain-containing protein [Actinomycetes bacterium KLBMP 9797]
MAAALAGATGGGGSAFADDVPRYAANEPAIAVVKPSTVYLEQEYTGYLRTKSTGKALHGKPVVFQRRCSGVVVNPDGYAVTTSLCVQPNPEIILINALYRLGRTLAAEQELSAGDLDSFVAGLLKTSVFTGTKAGSKPNVTLFAQFYVATPNATTTPAIRATVARALPAGDGNVALVKLSASNLPSVEIDARGAIATGSAVVAIGYGEGNSDDVAGKYTVRSKTMTVTKRTGTGRPGVDAEIGPLSRGGPVVDAQGRLLALLDADTTAPNEPNHDLIIVRHIIRLLALAGVSNDLSEVDRAYRQALAAYLDGRFAAAATGFDGVLRLAPTHELARAYRDQARERLALAGDSVENSADWTFYLLSAAAGVLIVWGLSLVHQTLRGTPQSAEPPGRANGARPSPDLDDTVVLPPLSIAEKATRQSASRDHAPDADDTVGLGPNPLADTVILPRTPPVDH